MRGFTRALPVCFVAVVTGCFSTTGSVGTNNGPAPTPTHAYWKQVSATLSQKPPSGEMKDLVRLIQSQTDALHALAPEGVDPALVAAAEEVIRCEEEVLRIADLFNCDVAILKTNQAMAQSFSEANRRATEAKKRLKGLRDSLNARYGGGFTAIGG